MRIYRYWAQRTETVPGGPSLHRDPMTGQLLRFEEKSLRKRIGSNRSQAAAEALLDELFAYVRKVRTGVPLDRDEELALADKFADQRLEGEYVAAICEEFVDEADPRNLVTRTRYGALALNSTDHVFVDIDYRPASLGERFCAWLGAPPAPVDRDRAVELVRKVWSVGLPHNLPCRIYETPKGLRLMAGGFPYVANDRETWRWMMRLKADSLFAQMCGRQNCFRARLTAKPSRIGLPSLNRIPFPWRSEEERRAKEQWVALYDEAASRYAACRFLTSLGPALSSPVVDYHDRMCRALTDLPLA